MVVGTKTTMEIKPEDMAVAKEALVCEACKATMEAWKDAIEKIDPMANKPFGINQHETESVFDYIDRILTAMMENLSLKGVTIAFTSMMGNHFITSKGKAAPIRLVNHDEWNELDGDR